MVLSIGLFLAFTHADTQCPYINSTAPNNYNPNTVRIMQFNAEWLFVDYYEPFGCPGEACPWKNESQAIQHLDMIADVIHTLNPDIVNICEVEGCDELHMLSDSLNNQTTQNPYSSFLVKGTDTSTGQNVGMLSKIRPMSDLVRVETRAEYPIPGSTCEYTGSPGTSALSKHYITEYRFLQYNIAFIGVHLLAYPDDATRCVQREAQAQIVQQIVHEYYTKQYEIIVLGDFNDFDGKIPDKNANTPISQVLDIVKGYSGVLNGTYELKSVSSKIDQVNRYTDWYDKNENGQESSDEYSEIDYILVSPELYDHIQTVFFYHNYSKSQNYLAPDHFPVVIDISM